MRFLLARCGGRLVYCLPSPLRTAACTADIMRFLLAHMGELGPVADQSLEQLGLLTGVAG